MAKPAAKKPKSASISAKRAQDLGTMLQKFYEAGYVEPRRALLFSFLKGIAAGFGAFLGGTIVIALLLWLLSLLDTVPFIDQIRRQLEASGALF